MQRWNVSVDHWTETPTSTIGFGRREGQAVALKIVKTQGDEWNAGAVVAAFEGRGVVRVLEHVPGAMLLERALPGASLSELVLAGRDEEATTILADVMVAMQPNDAPQGCATAEHWGRAFATYRATGDSRIPASLVVDAEQLYLTLCATQRTTRLLHGDLQHYNVVSDDTRGWLAIDPKGVVAEREFEIGPSLRNPHGMPELYSTPAIVSRRLTQMCQRASLDYGRAVRWAFAQAVLSAIWEIEDTGSVGFDGPALVLARTLQPMLH